MFFDMMPPTLQPLQWQWLPWLKLLEYDYLCTYHDYCLWFCLLPTSSHKFHKVKSIYPSVYCCQHLSLCLVLTLYSAANEQVMLHSFFTSLSPRSPLFTTLFLVSEYTHKYSALYKSWKSNRCEHCHFSL